MNSNPDVSYVCAAHREARVDPSDRSHALHLLKAEPYRRLEGLVFERLFTKAVAGSIHKGAIAFGWHAHLDSAGIPRYWIKLDAALSERNECDDALKDFAHANAQEVVRTWFDPYTRQFLAERLTVDGRPIKMPISEMKRRLLVESNGTLHRPYSANWQAPRNKRVLDYIKDEFSDSELDALACSRLLMNCHLDSWVSHSFMDIDAIALIDGRLRFVEFKRKFPARDGFFGIDTRPHQALALWLESAKSSLSLIILNDPLWNKDESPMHLLTTSSATAKYARWLGVELNHKAFHRGSLRTLGEDAGMYGGDRTQTKIAKNAIRILAEGMYFECLEHFLREQDSFPNVSMQKLEDERNQARLAFKTYAE